MKKLPLDLFCILQYFLPKRYLSRIVAWFMICRIEPIKNFIINSFISKYGVVMEDAAQPDPTAYIDFNAFFTRELKPGLRPIIAEPNSLAMPVDGEISQLGKINETQILQAKGVDYSLSTLLADQSELVSQFQHGHFSTIYLAPKDYHRIHMPLTGTLRQMIYVPGDLFSVNKAAATHVPNLFARNERLICIFETAIGPMAMILVGAMIVASIHTVWAGQITPGHVRKIKVWNYPVEGDSKTVLEKGAEMGHFQLGSTVVLLFAKDSVNWAEALQAESPVRLGELLGHIAVSS